MLELLAIPGRDAPPRSLDDWAGALAALGHPVSIGRDPPDGAIVEIGTLRTRGFALIEGGRIAAIDFELHATDPAASREALEAAARELGWELHDDEPDDEDD